jgi:hypothetical protein
MINIFSPTFEVFVFADGAKLIGRYKTKILPQYGDHLHIDFFPKSPNYIIHKRVLLSGYKQKINVFVIEVALLYTEPNKVNALMQRL